MKNTGRKAMTLILNAIFMMVTHRVPEDLIEKMEKEQKGFKIDNIYDKI